MFQNFYSDKNGLLREIHTHAHTHTHTHLEIASIEKLFFYELILKNLSSQTDSGFSNPFLLSVNQGFAGRFLRNKQGTLAGTSHQITYFR